MTWYDYLTREFRLDIDRYYSRRMASVDCPNCGKVSVVMIKNLKLKISRFGYYNCSICMKKKAIFKARRHLKDSDK